MDSTRPLTQQEAEHALIRLLTLSPPTLSSTDTASPLPAESRPPQHDAIKALSIDIEPAHLREKGKWKWTVEQTSKVSCQFSFAFLPHRVVADFLSFTIDSTSHL